MKLHPYVPLTEVVCRTNGSATQTQGLVHTSRSRNLPLNLVSFKSHQPFVRFSLNITQMFLSVSMCRSHDSAIKNQSQGHTSRSWDSVAGILLSKIKVKVTLQGHGILRRGYGCPQTALLLTLNMVSIVFFQN